MTVTPPTQKSKFLPFLEALQICRCDVHARQTLFKYSRCSSDTLQVLFRHSSSALQTLFKYSSDTLQVLFRHSSSTLQTLFKCSSDTLQVLFRHSSSALQTLFKCSSDTLQVLFRHSATFFPENDTPHYHCYVFPFSGNLIKPNGYIHSCEAMDIFIAAKQWIYS